MAVEEVGQCKFKSADDANIPVNIFLTEEKDENGNSFWKLTGDLFMPRKGFMEGAFEARSNDPAELRALVQGHVLPLYKTALGKLVALISGDTNSFYYWGS